MNVLHGLIEVIAVGGVLAMLVALAGKRAASPTERVKLHAAAWSLLNDPRSNSGSARPGATENRTERRSRRDRDE